MDKLLSYKPEVAGSISSFTSLSDVTLGYGTSQYELSCCLDVTHKQTNNQINKREQKTLNFSMMSHGITSMVMGSGSVLLNRKPKNGFGGSKEKNTSLSYHMTPNRSN